MPKTTEMTESKDLNKKLKSISQSDWEKLFALIKKIKQAKSFSKLQSREKGSDDVFTMPFYNWSNVVKEFHTSVYDIGITPVFDWMEWEEGKNILEKKKTNFNNLSIETLCKLITVIVRSERFCEGYLIDRFEDGTVLKILLSLKKKVLK